ncbi:MAG: DotI/IcmL/TraM family protein [Gammaproteobacteria bacterium]|nr:DotI/IcmL/TraM family protein [Gammaproteobacteria bacterium]
MANRVQKKNGVFFRTVIAATLVVVGLMSAVFWHIKHPPEPDYFQVKITENQQKQFTPLRVLSHRIFSRDALLLWLEEVVGDIYTFNAINYQQKFNEILSNDFTAEGADSFRQALENSQLIKQVTTQQLNLTGLVAGQPVTLQQGPLLGVYSWKIQMPVLLTFESASEVTTKRIIVTVLAIQATTQQSPNEVLISQFWSEE